MLFRFRAETEGEINLPSSNVVGGQVGIANPERAAEPIGGAGFVA
jgi:hypothetical protein